MIAKQEKYISDKTFWHGFDVFYEKYFENRTFNNIAEIGVAGGASIKWLLERFPNSYIYGADINIPTDENCPVDERFKFYQIDQGNVEQLKYFLNQALYDLIIEDGSHLPDHQILSLVEGISAIASKGIYILEDIHTSMESIASGNPGNALSVLLAIQHYRRLGISIDRDIAEKISHDSLLTADGVLFLDENIDTIELYKRTRLPDWCWSCKSVDFNFSQFKCVCGAGIFNYDDSMTFVIVKK